MCPRNYIQVSRGESNISQKIKVVFRDVIGHEKESSANKMDKKGEFAALHGMESLSSLTLELK